MIQRPQDMPAAFANAYNSGSVDALLGLYREDAVFLPDGVNELTGPAIREALQGFLALKGPMQRELVRVGEGRGSAVVVADGPPPTPDGNVLKGRTSDVVTRSADGTWRYAIDAPFGVKA